MRFDYAALAAAGIAKVTIGYSGTNDEGFINDITAEPVDVEYRTELYDTLQSAAYDLLENQHPGWEINEGSQGEITIDVAARKILLHHGTNVETTHYHDMELS